MTIWTGTENNDFHDFFWDQFTGNDWGFGKGGNDTMWGWEGNDILYGGNGNDTLYGEKGIDTLVGDDGNDALYGGIDKDYLFGGNGNDHLQGGWDADILVGGAGADKFYFDTIDTGDKFAGKADTISDFADVDQIYLKGNYSYAGATLIPGEGKYGITGSGTNWVVTYNSPTDSGWHDIIVKGADPHGDISFF